MGYQILPNIIFLLSLFGLILIFLKNLQNVKDFPEKEFNKPNPVKALWEKGLPAIAVSKTKRFFQIWLSKIWRIILEVKDLKPAATASYKIKQLWKAENKVLPNVSQSPETDSVIDESYFLSKIKNNPHDLDNYDKLGQFYIAQKAFGEALDIYLYLVEHKATNPEYQAKLAYCYFQLDDLVNASKYYEKSVELDSTQPNRYYNLGLIYRALENPEKTEHFFAKALELDPENEKYKNAFKKSQEKQQSQL